MDPPGQALAIEEIVQETVREDVMADHEKRSLGRDSQVSEAPPSSSSALDSVKAEKLDSQIIQMPADIHNDDAFRHLPEHEAAILRRQLHIPNKKIGFFTLYRYATRNDYLIIFVSCLAAIVGGAATPLMTIIFGQLTGLFQGYYLGTVSASDFSSGLSHYTLYFVYIAVGEFVTIYICTAGFIYTGEHITRKIREQYMAAILRQNIAFFDKLGAGEITTRITADTNLVQDGISGKVGLTLTGLATFITALVIGFIKYWKLTLILCSAVFCLVAVMGIGSTFLVKYNKQSLESYALGGTIAEEVISSIRNATAFGTQEKLAALYDVHLCEAEKYGKKLKLALGCMIAGMMGVFYLNYALAFWQGSRYLVDGSCDLSDILTIMLSIMIGAFTLGNVAPNSQAFSTAVAAATKIYNTIDRVSPLDPTNADGEKLDVVEGTIELCNIKHIYPSRPEVVVMDNVNLSIPAGKTTALVGASGCGKSTIVGLVERFYDPVGGKVTLDGHEVNKLNLKWLRSQISLVSQEPTLFGTTIYKNIAHGLIGTQWESSSHEEQVKLIEEAARAANAHDFIIGLPDGYHTHVGERGFLLSGGQKQRIAIARAMVSNPKILLLDEATSALDTKSEGVVQAALDVAARGRTTIVIAHRLSTIKTADNIVVMQRGKIVEQGTHNQLIEQKGPYFNLVEAQRISAQQEERAVIASPAEDPIDDINGHQLSEPLNRVTTATKSLHDVEHTTSKTSRFTRPNFRRNGTENELARLDTKKSVSSVLASQDAAEKKPHYSLWVLIRLIASFNRPEIGWMIGGLLASIVAGGSNPVSSVFFAKSIVSLSLPPNMYDKLRHDADFWSLMYLMLAIVTFLAYASQGAFFSACSESLIHRARIRSFRVMLRQEIAWFDREENSAGALTSFLSTGATNLAGISGVTLGTILVVSTTLIACLAIAVSIAWKLGLVCAATIPILLTCGFLRFWMLARFDENAKKSYEKSASYACEATAAVRTVASLTREKDVWNHYHQDLVEQGRRSLRSLLKSSTLYASSQSFVFLCNALGFWYGGTLIASGEYSQFQFFAAFACIIFGAQTAGTIFSFAPDMGKAKSAARDLKFLFDRQPNIDHWSESGEAVSNVTGHIEFRDVHFRYPTRPEQPVLRGLNLTVKPGEYVALVGASGCGKSTTIALTERFYDPLAGEVLIDGTPITKMNLAQYRSHLALVSQEPTLYQGSIRENILLGTGADAPIDEQSIVQACKDANIYDFICSLPEGMNTIVGSKGSMLSGGQKQRIAIARALIRDPKVLLLDEATSALDSESEKVVQAALDAAARGRTTIAVAHRLSTIQKADVIYVIDAGRVVESGTHEALLQAKKWYFELVNLQSLEKSV